MTSKDMAEALVTACNHLNALIAKAATENGMHVDIERVDCRGLDGSGFVLFGIVTARPMAGDNL